MNYMLDDLLDIGKLLCRMNIQLIPLSLFLPCTILFALQPENTKLISSEIDTSSFKPNIVLSSKMKPCVIWHYPT